VSLRLVLRVSWRALANGERRDAGRKTGQAAASQLRFLSGIEEFDQNAGVRRKMASSKRVTAWMPMSLLNEMEKVNKKIDEKYGVKVSLSEAQRIMCVVYVRSVLAALEGEAILSVGELEQVLCSFIKRKGREE
jgi:hypothetical protein